MKKRKKKTKSLREKGWRELSARLREETPYCQKCGKPASECRLNVHHLRSRRHRPDLLLDEQGLINLCPGCHQFARGSAHKDPGAFYAWLSEAFPEKWEWLKAHMD